MAAGHLKRLEARDDEYIFDNATQRGVMMEVAWHADNRGILRLTQGELAEHMLLTRVTVNRTLSILVAKGYLKRLDKFGRYAVAFAPSVPEVTTEPQRTSASEPVPVEASKLSDDDQEEVITFLKDLFDGVALKLLPVGFEKEDSTMERLWGRAIKEGLVRHKETVRGQDGPVAAWTLHL